MLDEIRLNILLIGDSSSGKSQLLLRYVDEYFFPEKHLATIELNIDAKTYS